MKIKGQGWSTSKWTCRDGSTTGKYEDCPAFTPPPKSDVEEKYMIFSVAIGDSVDNDKINTLAGNKNNDEINTLAGNKSERKISVDNFNQLNNVISNLESQICALPVNCAYETTEQKTQCDCQTGLHTITKTHTITQEPANGGAACTLDGTPLTQQVTTVVLNGVSCDTSTCPIDCVDKEVVTQDEQCTCNNGIGSSNVYTNYEIVTPAQNNGAQCVRKGFTTERDCSDECPVDCVDKEVVTQDEQCTCDKGKGSLKVYTNYEIVTPAQNNGAQCARKGFTTERDCSDDCPVDCVDKEVVTQDEQCTCDNGKGSLIVYTNYEIVTPAQNNGARCVREGFTTERDCSNDCPVDCVDKEVVTQDEQCTCDKGKGNLNVYTNYEIVTPAQNNGAQCARKGFTTERDCSDDCPVDCVDKEVVTQDEQCTCDKGKGSLNVYTNYEIVTPAQNNGAQCVREGFATERDCSDDCPVDCVDKEVVTQDEQCTCDKNEQCTCDNGKGSLNVYTNYEIVTPAQNNGAQCVREGFTTKKDCSEECPIERVDCVDQESIIRGECTCHEGTGTLEAQFIYEIITLPKGEGRECTRKNKMVEEDCSVQCPVDCIDQEVVEEDQCTCSKGIGVYNIDTSYKVVTEAKNGGAECTRESTTVKQDCSVQCPVDCVDKEVVEEEQCSCTDGIGTYKVTTAYKVISGAQNGGAECSRESTTVEKDCSIQCPVDCVDQEMVEEEQCSCSDGVGVYNIHRSYEIITRAQNGGAECTRESTTVKQDCSIQCPVDCVDKEVVEEEQCSCIDGVGTFKVTTAYEVITGAQNGGAECSRESTTVEKDCSKQCPVDCVDQEMVDEEQCFCSDGVGVYNIHTSYKIITGAQNGGAECTRQSTTVKQDCKQCSCTDGIGTYNVTTAYEIITIAQNGGAECTRESNTVEKDCSKQCPVDCVDQQVVSEEQCSCSEGVGTYKVTTAYEIIAGAQNGGAECTRETTITESDCSSECIVVTEEIKEDEDQDGGSNTAIIAGAAAAGAAFLAAGAGIAYLVRQNSLSAPSASDADRNFIDQATTQVMNPLHTDTSMFTNNAL
eukprot:Awhi_evm1s10597